ncbi:MAG: ketoacyl-ACP synthase III [Oscillospiraceae bacterium]|nr:ketoacyl-ACP synthase III [Oscillospiraceae bacterium]
MTIKLLGTGSYLPATIISNAEFEKTLDTTDEWIVKRTGIRERRIARDETLLDLALGSAKAALADAGEPRIDAVIAASASLDYQFPPLACRIGTALGLDGPFCMDVGATCSGFVYGLDIAAHYINAGSAETVLVAAAEKLSSLTDYTDRSTCILFGDAAAAAVVTKGDKAYFSHLACAADPENSLFCRAGETIKMNGSGVYKFAVNAAAKSIRQVLEKASVGIDDIDWFILHQANIRIIDGIVSRVGIPKDKVPITLDRYANPSSATIPLTIDVMREDGRLKPGQRVLLSGFGAGLTYGASIMEV